MLAYFVSMVLWVQSLMMRSRVWNLGYRFGEDGYVWHVDVQRAQLDAVMKASYGHR